MREQEEAARHLSFCIVWKTLNVRNCALAPHARLHHPHIAACIALRSPERCQLLVGSNRRASSSSSLALERRSSKECRPLACNRWVPKRSMRSGQWSRCPLPRQDCQCPGAHLHQACRSYRTSASRRRVRMSFASRTESRHPFPRSRPRCRRTTSLNPAPSPPALCPATECSGFSKICRVFPPESRLREGRGQRAWRLQPNSGPLAAPLRARPRGYSPPQPVKPPGPRSRHRPRGRRRTRSSNSTGRNGWLGLPSTSSTSPSQPSSGTRHARPTAAPRLPYARRSRAA